MFFLPMRRRVAICNAPSVWDGSAEASRALNTSGKAKHQSGRQYALLRYRLRVLPATISMICGADRRAKRPP
jgi:hypothetical protein